MATPCTLQTLRAGLKPWLCNEFKVGVYLLLLGIGVLAGIYLGSYYIGLASGRCDWIGNEGMMRLTGGAAPTNVFKATLYQYSTCALPGIIYIAVFLAVFAFGSIIVFSSFKSICKHGATQLKKEIASAE